MRRSRHVFVSNIDSPLKLAGQPRLVVIKDHPILDRQRVRNITPLLGHARLRADWGRAAAGRPETRHTGAEPRICGASSRESLIGAWLREYGYYGVGLQAPKCKQMWQRTGRDRSSSASSAAQVGDSPERRTVATRDHPPRRPRAVLRQDSVRRGTLVDRSALIRRQSPPHGQHPMRACVGSQKLPSQQKRQRTSTEMTRSTRRTRPIVKSPVPAPSCGSAASLAGCCGPTRFAPNRSAGGCP